MSYLAQLAFDPDQTGFFHHKRTRMPFCLSALALASTLAYLPFIGIMTPSMFAALSYMRHIANRERYLKSQQKELLTLRETLVAYSANLHNETIYQHASSTLPTRKKA